ALAELEAIHAAHSEAIQLEDATDEDDDRADAEYDAAHAAWWEKNEKWFDVVDRDYMWLKKRSLAIHGLRKLAARGWKSELKMPNDNVVPFVPPAPTPAAEGSALTAPRGDVLPNDCDDSLATGFAGHHANDLRYCEEMGRWLLWTGTHWRPDKTSAAYNS